MEVKKQGPEGYKLTEVGMVPVDWRVVTLDSIFKFQGGSQPPRSTFIFSEKKEYIRLLQIRDYKTDKYKTFIPINLANRFCERDDIMIGRYGPPIFQILKGISGAYNVALMKAIPISGLHKKLGWYILKDRALFEFIEKLSQRSSGQTGVDIVQLRSYQIPLPPTLTEQTAIANALSDADGLIAALDDLIEKKRQIKQGTMQQLLTPPHRGGRRLKGFSGAWLDRKLGEIGKFKNGINKGKEDFGFGNRFVNLMDVFGEPEIDSYSKLGLVNCSDSELNTYNLKKGDVLFVRSSVKPSGVGLTSVLKIDFPKSVYSGFLIRFRTTDQLSDSYKKYCFYDEKFRNKLIESSTVSANTNINQDALKELKLSFPPTLAEQTAIATILSEMDGEIEALEAKRAKYQTIKQGMMQELLTGRVRLV